LYAKLSQFLLIQKQTPKLTNQVLHCKIAVSGSGFRLQAVFSAVNLILLQPCPNFTLWTQQRWRRKSSRLYV